MMKLIFHTSNIQITKKKTEFLETSTADFPRFGYLALFKQLSIEFLETCLQNILS